MTTLRVHTWPAPVAPVETLLAEPGPAYVWGGDESGLGAAATIIARGATRCSQVRDRAIELLAGIESDGAAPRLFGGFAFAPGACAIPCWRELDDARFVLPRWRYARSAHGATLSVTLGADDALAGALAERDHLFELLERPPPQRTPVASFVEQLPLDKWRRLVTEIATAIAMGRCEKIVLARRARLRADAPIDARSVLARLIAPATTRFAFRVADTCFVGASPERLVERRGAAVLADALAGSAASAQTLLASLKDRREHQFVVDAVAASLLPLCEQLDVAGSPTVRALRDVVHLYTPVSGVARAGVHVLDLVAALAPTPAVGGVPTRTAVEWIADREPAPRGWYAGPFGWLDARGDGCFVVALRSGVIDGDTATIYAGAGIVAGSQAEAEYAETALKQRALATALGAATPVLRSSSASKSWSRA